MPIMRLTRAMITVTCAPMSTLRSPDLNAPTKRHVFLQIPAPPAFIAPRRRLTRTRLPAHRPGALCTRTAALNASTPVAGLDKD